MSAKDSPPWERNKLPQIPFVKPSSPSFLSPEAQSLHTVGAGRSNSEPSHERASDHMAMKHAQQMDGMWAVPDARSPLITSAPHSPARSSSAPASRSAADRPPPPSAYERSYTPPAAPKGPVVAMPGTMSSRPTKPASPGKAKKRAPRGTSEAVNARTDSQTTLRSRFKTAWMDIFHRDPVDPGSFERIEDRHWSDEY